LGAKVSESLAIVSETEERQFEVVEVETVRQEAAFEGELALKAECQWHRESHLLEPNESPGLR
jgi:hypothetical protein